MTSSLVGSEMCIRDRFTSALDALVAFALEAFFAFALETLFAFVLVCVAVSYTHLTLPTICSV
eukprot:10903694-Prorocentrum_lima.AAC.1